VPREVLRKGLVISPVTYLELAPAFEGDAALQEQFLAEVGSNGQCCERFRTRKQGTSCGSLIFRRSMMPSLQNAGLQTS
jgi:hypothetical protein